jgi:hypothetical protein
MKIGISKRNDGSGVLRCTRVDGSVTWQKQKDLQAPFFALHDLTHFAVETTLGYRNGFFGLIAQGWGIEDTTGKGKRGPLPDEATEVERLVGLLFTERASGAVWSAEEFNDVWHARRLLADVEVLVIRKRRSELFRQWADVPVGGTLELQFQ